MKGHTLVFFRSHLLLPVRFPNWWGGFVLVRGIRISTLCWLRQTQFEITRVENRSAQLTLESSSCSLSGTFFLPLSLIWSLLFLNSLILPSCATFESNKTFAFLHQKQLAPKRKPFPCQQLFPLASGFAFLSASAAAGVSSPAAWWKIAIW